MNREVMEMLATDFLAAWNSHDVERVLDCYTDDVRYRDPNTRGEIRGRAALRRYLTRLFADWRMHWRTREVFDLDGTDGAALLWRATLRRVGTDRAVDIEGMDLAVLRGTQVARNEVYFDRTPLAALETSDAR